MTEALTHEVGGMMEVAVLSTPHGALVGTTYHPVLVGSEWHEIAAAHAAGLLPEVSFEQRFVDALYNLEIDGDAPGASAHAYVVNGVIASGLGDNEVLNLAFPRQESWKAEKERNAATEVEKFHADVNESLSVGGCPSMLVGVN